MILKGDETMKTILLICMACCFAAACAGENTGNTHANACAYRLKHSSRVRENMEWTTFFATNLADRKTPRAFFIGDSICRDYITPAARALRGTANCTHWTTSRCVTDPLYLPELEIFLSLAPHAVICFNNGLHSQYTNPGEYENAYRKAVQYLKAKCPNAKIILVTSTPVQADAFNAAVVRMNRTVAKIAKEEGLEVFDAYRFMNRAECPSKWRDGVHYNAAANTSLGKKIAETVRPHLPAKASKA